MDNTWQRMQDDLESRLPVDIEFRVVQQASAFSVFGKVVELFVPNALETAARLIGGDGQPGNQGGTRGTTDEEPDWRKKPR